MDGTTCRKKRINTASKGRRLEHRARDRLLAVCAAAHPWAVTCIRSAASKGAFDLGIFCACCASLTLVQVKSNSGASPAERQRLQRIADELAGRRLKVSIQHWRFRDRKPPDVLEVEGTP